MFFTTSIPPKMVVNPIENHQFSHIFSLYLGVVFFPPLGFHSVRTVVGPGVGDYGHSLVQKPVGHHQLRHRDPITIHIQVR